MNEKAFPDADLAQWAAVAACVPTDLQREPDIAIDAATILAFVAMARRAPRWIPVEERLPEEDRTVLMYAHASNDDPDCFNIPDGGVHWVGAASFEEGSFFELGDEDSLYPLRVTHWQPLPAPPKP